MESKQRQRYDYEALAATLFDELVAHPEGMDMAGIIELLEVPDRNVATKVITTLRLTLGEGDTITVPVIRKGPKHIYSLSGVWDESQDWLQRRARFLRQFIRTEVAALESLSNGADGRTKEGKVLRLALTDAKRLEEDLTEYLSAV